MIDGATEPMRTTGPPRTTNRCLRLAAAAALLVPAVGCAAPEGGTDQTAAASSWIRETVAGTLADLTGGSVAFSPAVGSCGPTDAHAVGLAGTLAVTFPTGTGPSPGELAETFTAAGEDVRMLDRAARPTVEVHTDGGYVRLFPVFDDPEATAEAFIPGEYHLPPGEGAEGAQAAGWGWAGFVCDVGWPPPDAGPDAA
jgi:hypothetical protein